MTEIRLEWGEQGVVALRDWAEALVIVDVLSFSTCVSVAIDHGAEVLPFEHAYDAAAAFARKHDAAVAKRRRDAGPTDVSLSPPSFVNISAGTRYVLPSPNGSTLARMAKNKTVYAGCLRNAAAVAAVMRGYKRVALIPAGERWPDNSLRPAIEDWLGAGAIAAEIESRCSPEAELAALSFKGAQADLENPVHASVSGRELMERGYQNDVSYGAALNISDTVPVLTEHGFQRLEFHP